MKMADLFDTLFKDSRKTRRTADKKRSSECGHFFDIVIHVVTSYYSVIANANVSIP